MKIRFVGAAGGPCWPVTYIIITGQCYMFSCVPVECAGPLIKVFVPWQTVHIFRRFFLFSVRRFIRQGVLYFRFFRDYRYCVRFRCARDKVFILINGNGCVIVVSGYCPSEHLLPFSGLFGFLNRILPRDRGTTATAGRG